ncbi:MAG TPA: Hsp20/alpha crystallin family protein [Thermoanaerobaculia bacterium]|nr:Hsp20/alpha crystallin family protein [Thermoanaerobaculia bacterium]
MTNFVTRWNPSQQVAAAREPLYRLFDTFFNEGGEDLTSRTWTPPVDIQETDEAYRIHAELPGLTKDDIQITLENNVLRLSGERKLEKDVKKESYHRIERTYGAFSRSFALPTQVSPDKVEAKFDNGVLTIVVPKAEQAKPRRIAVS